GASGSNNNDLISALDAGNPLYFQTNDNNSRSLINIKLTGLENYRVWATALKIALQARNKMVFVDGSCVKSVYASSVPLTNQWEMCNVVVLSWLLSSNSDDKYLSQVYSENVVETKLPNVGDAFVIVCREESYRGLGSDRGSKTPIGHPNGTITNIRKVGNLKLTNNIVLFDVLVIPEYCVSLLSVHKLITDSKLHVGFDEYDCVIQDLKREIVLETGSEAGGLYRPLLPSALRAKVIQELHELHAILAFVDSRLDSIEQFLNSFANQPDETDMNDLKSDDE
nr:ribonuclease H-like domain-containing protein [Tanacetum cinerariifolium]